MSKNCERFDGPKLFLIRVGVGVGGTGWGEMLWKG